MRLTQYTDYSLRVLVYLGLNAGRRSTIREISDAYGISRNHLMKVVQQLASEGYVTSVRGVGGGLSLGRTPEEISIGELVRAMEPDMGLVECMRPDNQCVIAPACGLTRILCTARDAFLESLDAHTLADVLTREQRPVLTRQLGIRIDSA